MNPKILIADTEQWSCEILAAVAQSRGYEPIMAEHGVAAVELFRAVAPHAVVVDSMLPKLDGLKVSSRIRATPPGRVIPVLLTSAIYHRDDTIIPLQRRHGFSELLEKPFTEADVARLLDRLLGLEAACDRSGEDLPALEEAEAPETPGGDRPVGELLLETMRDRKTGLLTVKHEGDTANLLFERGALVGVSSSPCRHTLGDILVCGGRLSPEQLEWPRRVVSDSSGSATLATTLVALGVLSAEELTAAVAAQASAVLLDVVGVSGASLRWRDDYLPREFSSMALESVELVFWGLRRLDERGDFHSRLPATRAVLARTADGSAGPILPSLTRLEEQLLRLVDGHRRLGEIMSVAGRAKPGVARALVGLLAAGAVRALEIGPEAPPDASESGVQPAVGTGDLTELSPAQVFARLWQGGATGCLRLTSNDHWRDVYFEKGQVVWARSSLAEQRLGEVLLDVGAVLAKDLDTALRDQTNVSGRKLGAILVENGAITLQELDRARRIQVQRIALDALSLTEATYAFDPAASAPEDSITLAMPTPHFIHQAALRVPAPASVHRLLSSPATVLMKAWDAERVERVLGIKSDGHFLLEALDSGPTGVELAALNLVPEETLERLLHSFLALGVITAVSGRIVEQREASDTPSFDPSDLLDGLDDVEAALPAPAQTGDSSFAPRPAAAETSDATLARLTVELAMVKAENQALRARIAAMQAQARTDGEAGGPTQTSEDAPLTSGH